jgi:hypothetical protein
VRRSAEEVELKEVAFKEVAFRGESGFRTDPGRR